MIKPNIINEAVNIEKKCIFVAIPKTGTTSVRSQIKQKGFPLVKSQHLNINQIQKSIYMFLLINSLEKNTTFPSNTIPDKIIQIKANEIFNEYFKFSAVRNPWARAVSLYSRKEGVKVNCSFEEFIEKHTHASDTCFHPTLHKNQLDWICDENDKIIIDYVYKLEEFEQAIKIIEEKTNGNLKLVNEIKNKNQNSNSKKYREMYNEKTKNIIAKNFEKDIDFFKYTF